MEDKSVSQLHPYLSYGYRSKFGIELPVCTCSAYTGPKVIASKTVRRSLKRNTSVWYSELMKIGKNV